MKKISLFFLIFISAALLSCSFNKPTLLNYINVEEPSQIKRQMKYMQRPTLLHWSTVAYKKNTKTLRFLLSPEQKEVIGKYGQPNYIRKFRSTDKEVVYEWLFIDDNKLVQIINRKIAFEGPITDFEHVLIKRGYPSFVHHQLFNNDTIVRDTIIYEQVFGVEKETYSFENGKLFSHQSTGSFESLKDY